jgi:hypothetical protein
MDEEMYTDDFTDEISELVDEAYAIFNVTTVSEVMDMRDRQSQEDFLNKVYNNPEPEAINLYLDVLKRLERAAYLPHCCYCLPIACIHYFNPFLHRFYRPASFAFSSACSLGFASFCSKRFFSQYDGKHIYYYNIFSLF